MRPHRLRVTAFGAFGGTVEVSFEDLACSGLFLLHGETGAGKTTLLDAIGFALYGRVPGERGKARRLRSDHAAPSTPTEVQLEATLGGRRMRITRKPEQERAKLRGTGTTTEQARVLLEEQAGKLQRLPSSLAYVRPAVTAYKYGDGDELADEFAAKARSAGARQLVRSVPGLRLLFWNSLSPAGRQAVRSAQDSTRELVKTANLRIRGGIGSERVARDGGNT